MPTGIANTSLYGNSHALYVPSVPAVRKRGIIIGQSNGNGTTGRVGVDGVAFTSLFPGKTVRFRHQGSDLSAIGANTSGPAYRMLQRMCAEANEVDLIRRSLNGSGDVSVIETQIPGAQADMLALSIDPATIDFVSLIHGEENSTAPESQSIRYADIALERICQLSEALCPNAVVFIWLLSSTSYGAYWERVRAAQVEVASRRANRFLVNTISATVTAPSGLTFADTVHFSADATGYDEGVDRQWACIGA